MKRIATDIPDVFIVEPRVYGDERGFFFESFNQKRWLMEGLRDWARHAHQATLDWAPYVSTEKP